MDRFVETCFKEYDNLWNEKLVHKESLRKFTNYITYLTTVSSFAITIAGLSYLDIIVIEKDTIKIHPIVNILCLIYIPSALVSMGFILNDMFQVYVIANQIGEIEKKINFYLKPETPLVWEHKVCDLVFAGSEQELENNKKVKIKNIIRINNWTLTAFMVGALILSGILGYSYLISLIEKNESFVWITSAYTILIMSCILPVIIGGTKLKGYTKTSSILNRAIMAINTTHEKDNG